MNRYLLRLSYMGKPFRGSQRQVRGGIPRPDDPSTIQGRLETALKEINPTNEPVVVMASRTDAGVSALNTMCHVDLHRRNSEIYPPESITICLNKYFRKSDVPIRIIRSYLAPEEFHCRHKAVSRTYLYRLYISNADRLNVGVSSYYVPIEEWGRCLFFCTNTFDVSTMKEAVKLFCGVHDFRTFMAKHEGSDKKITRKHLDFIRIVENSPYGYSDSFSWPADAPSQMDTSKFIDIYIKGKGFLYKQVRRTVASLIAVAQGKVSCRDIKFMLEVPSANSWLPQLKTVPAFGLYLCDIEYSKEDLKSFNDGRV